MGASRYPAANATDVGRGRKATLRIAVHGADVLGQFDSYQTAIHQEVSSLSNEMNNKNVSMFQLKDKDCWTWSEAREARVRHSLEL